MNQMIDPMSSSFHNHIKMFNQVPFITKLDEKKGIGFRPFSFLECLDNVIGLSVRTSVFHSKTH